LFLDALADGVPERFTLELAGVKHGKITLELAYFRLAKTDSLSARGPVEDIHMIDLCLSDLMDAAALDIVSQKMSLDQIPIPETDVPPTVSQLGLSPKQSQRHRSNSTAGPMSSTRMSMFSRDNNRDSTHSDSASEQQNPTNTSTNSKLLSSLFSSTGPRLSHFVGLDNDSDDDITHNDEANRNTGKKRFSFTNISTGIGLRTDTTRALNVAGVLTISEIAVKNLKSVKTVLASAHYIACYVSFSLGQVKRQTVVSSKQMECRFKETFHFVVGNIEQEVLTVKVKKLTSLGYRQTLASFEIRVKNVIMAPEQVLGVDENIYTDKNLATGTLNCSLKYRRSASRTSTHTHSHTLSSTK
jgi:hypothetical protein